MPTVPPNKALVSDADAEFAGSRPRARPLPSILAPAALAALAAITLA